MPGTVYVGIVTYNSLHDLPLCLNALDRQTYPHIHITVLDNASSDGVMDWLATHAPEIHRIASDENMGYGRGHNAMITECNPQSNDYYLALNPDAQLEPDYIAALVKALDEHAAGWATGCLYLSADDGTATDLIYSVGHGILGDGYAFNIGYRLPQADMPAEPFEVFGAPGAAALYRATLIERIKIDDALFDPALFLYYEDVDVDWRAQAAMFRCMSVPQAVAWHRGSTPSGELKMQSLANRYAVAIKNMPLPGLVFAILPRLLLHVIARMLLTPAQGRQFAGYLRRVLPVMWQRRSHTMQMPIREWVRWSAGQPTGQPRNLWQRWKRFQHTKTEK
ncbi:MAG: glycosyltransferase family 2 protein [Chloroflexota bacterium]